LRTYDRHTSSTRCAVLPRRAGFPRCAVLSVGSVLTVATVRTGDPTPTRLALRACLASHSHRWGVRLLTEIDELLAKRVHIGYQRLTNRSSFFEFTALVGDTGGDEPQQNTDNEHSGGEHEPSHVGSP
jgi:hypothetical protein